MTSGLTVWGPGEGGYGGVMQEGGVQTAAIAVPHLVRGGFELWRGASNFNPIGADHLVLPILPS